MNITVIGSGYVGLVTGACFAEMGNSVTCVDVDESRISDLQRGILPVYEPGLDVLIANNQSQKRLRFTASLEDGMRESDILFLTVGTPQSHDGSADMKYVLAVAREIGKYLGAYAVVVDKSTVPVGTADIVRSTIRTELDARGVDLEFDVVSNPEFLKEGAAIEDFMSPDRIVIGTDSLRAKEMMAELYAPFVRNHPRTIYMGVRDAEMTKYAANAFLATKISFINEIAGLCEYLSVDIENVRLGIGSDQRIGFQFIYAGAGYGGSCFPKDIKALVGMSEKVGFEPVLLKAVESRNNAQRHHLFSKITAELGSDLNGKVIAVWGLSFKPGTDDMREAPSKILIEALIAAGASVRAYDPVAMQVAAGEFSSEYFRDGRLILASAQYEAAIDADALVLVTEWKPFRHPEFKTLQKLMNSPLIFDGRNQYDPQQLARLGFTYHGMGREVAHQL